MNITRFFRMPFDLPADLRSTVRYYYADISWWGLWAGTISAFLNIYAVRIGATPTQIGLLTALPATVSLFLSLPFAGLVRQMGAHRATWLGALFSRLPLVSYALLPFFLNEPTQVNAILAIALVVTVPTALIGIGFNQLMMEALPGDWRGMVVGVRNALFSIITFVVTMISGQLLTRLPFPRNYQLVFFIGFVGASMTAYELYHVRTRPELCESALQNPMGVAPGRLAWRERFLPQITAQGQRYIRILALLFLVNMITNMVNPLVPAVLVNILRLSDAWISFGTAANSLIIFLISLLIAPITRKIGNRGGTALGMVLVSVQTVILALAHDPALYLLSVLFGGLGSGILLSAQFNFNLDNVPDTQRSSWLSWNLLVGNAALLLGALLGPWVAEATSIPLALGIFGLLRLVVGGLILKFGG